MSHNRGETLLTIKNIADGPSAHGAHRLSTITTVPGCVHIRMDSTLHRVLPSVGTMPSSPLKTKQNFPLRIGSSAASTCKCELMSFARFC